MCPGVIQIQPLVAPFTTFQFSSHTPSRNSDDSCYRTATPAPAQSMAQLGSQGCRLVRDIPEKWWPMGLPKGPCRLCKKLACTLGLRAPCVSQNCSAAAAWGLRPGRLNPTPCVIHPAIPCSLPCMMRHAVLHLISSANLTRRKVRM